VNSCDDGSAALLYERLNPVVTHESYAGREPGALLKDPSERTDLRMLPRHRYGVPLVRCT
jgi:hypothetical protein